MIPIARDTINLRMRLDEAKNDLCFTFNYTEFDEHFKTEMLYWLEKYQILALECLWEYYEERMFSPSLFSEILELIGIATLNNKRVDLLKNAFANDNVEIRHGAVEGISNLDPQLAIPILEEFLKIEKTVVLRTMIENYIEQLKRLLY